MPIFIIITCELNMLNKMQNFTVDLGFVQV